MITFEGKIPRNMTCVDMHFHTTHSDGAATVDEALAKIRRMRIGLAITDHNAISGYLEAKHKDKDAFLIPAIEVKSLELVDILFYFYAEKGLVEFYKKEISGHIERFLHSTRTDIPLGRLYMLSKKYNCVCSVAHPFGYALRSNQRNVFRKYEEILKKFPVFEAINGGNSRKANQKAVEYIQKNKKLITAGSDGHSIFRLGSVITCSKAKTPAQFLDNIKKGECRVTGKEARLGKLGEYALYGINRLQNLTNHK